jgi:uncharacterized coiled-coil protein SlyX
MTTSERVDELETLIAETKADMAELRAMIESQKMDLQKLVNRPPTTPPPTQKQQKFLQKMTATQEQILQLTEKEMKTLTASVEKMNGSVNLAVKTEVSRFNKVITSAIVDIVDTAKSTTSEYHLLLVELDRRNAQLMHRRLVIDAILIIAIFINIFAVIF